MDNLFQQEYATSIGGHLSAKSSSLRPLLSLLQLQRETRITWRLAAGGWRLLPRQALQHDQNSPGLRAHGSAMMGGDIALTVCSA
jgi:hypothetical protein